MTERIPPESFLRRLGRKWRNRGKSESVGTYDEIRRYLKKERIKDPLYRLAIKTQETDNRCRVSNDPRITRRAVLSLGAAAAAGLIFEGRVNSIHSSGISASDIKTQTAEPVPTPTPNHRN